MSAEVPGSRRDTEHSIFQANTGQAFRSISRSPCSEDPPISELSFRQVVSDHERSVDNNVDVNNSSNDSDEISNVIVTQSMTRLNLSPSSGWDSDSSADNEIPGLQPDDSDTDASLLTDYPSSQSDDSESDTDASFIPGLQPDSDTDASLNEVFREANFSHSDSGDSPHDRRPMSRRGPHLIYLDDFDDSETGIPALVNRSSSESLVTRSSSESDSEYEDDQVLLVPSLGNRSSSDEEISISENAPVNRMYRRRGAIFRPPSHVFGNFIFAGDIDASPRRIAPLWDSTPYVDLSFVDRGTPDYSKPILQVLRDYGMWTNCDSEADDEKPKSKTKKEHKRRRRRKQFVQKRAKYFSPRGQPLSQRKNKPRSKRVVRKRT